MQVSNYPVSNYREFIIDSVGANYQSAAAPVSVLGSDEGMRLEDTKKNEKLQGDLRGKIEKYQGYKNNAEKVTKTALMAIAAGLALTALFFASPIIPFSLVILVPVTVIVALFVAGFMIGSGQGSSVPNPNHASGPSAGDLCKASVYIGKVGINGGMAWGRAIYTVNTLAIAGLANLAIAAVALPVAIGGAIAYTVCNRKIARLQNQLNELIRNSENNL